MTSRVSRSPPKLTMLPAPAPAFSWSVCSAVLPCLTIWTWMPCSLSHFWRLASVLLAESANCGMSCWNFESCAEIGPDSAKPIPTRNAKKQK